MSPFRVPDHGPQIASLTGDIAGHHGHFDFFAHRVTGRERHYSGSIDWATGQSDSINSQTITADTLMWIRTPITHSGVYQINLDLSTGQEARRQRQRQVDLVIANSSDAHRTAPLPRRRVIRGR